MIFFRLQFRILFQYLSGGFTGLLQHFRILEHITQTEFKNTALTDAEQIPRPPQLQVLTGNIEAVIGSVQYL